MQKKNFLLGIGAIMLAASTLFGVVACDDDEESDGDATEPAATEPADGDATESDGDATEPADGEEEEPTATDAA
jgi:hypothetical protein